MPRRTATMLASLLTLIALLCAGVLIPVPYAGMSPGPSYDVLGKDRETGEPVLQIKGRKTYGAEGHLNMTTVQVTRADHDMNLFEAVHGWLSDDDIVVPYENLYPDDKSAEEVNEENAEEFTLSQESAKVAALRHLKIPVRTRVVVAAVVKGGAAQGKLHAGDVIVKVDGKPVRDPADVGRLVSAHRPGERVEFSVVPAERAKKAEEAEKKAGGAGRTGEEAARTVPVTITTRKAPDGDRAVVGIQAAADHSLPFRIDIKLADVGGPSAGLMFALAVIDRLTPGSMTGGKFIAGTGTIDDNGEVNPIGGIAMKTIGARRAGAEYFLTPADNCAAAAADVPDGLTLVKVRNLDDAVRAVEDISAGRTSELPSCTKR
ncbi:PDZ domain-containing protein [Streptomyces pactum]|uniref:endopeptidase La n=1 Tax=Streptomyces pactum TaxID=68249 RepID=A0ABS0NNZ4_9ACTN|nr:PDZ domain-containing protein [Streptomyces pactum]MBH5336893.1 PDZ domain-containing protein [Streptomyces pactum]